MKSILPKKGRFVILELKSTISLTPDYGPDKKAKNKQQNGQGNQEKAKEGGSVRGITASNRPTRELNPFPISAAIDQLSDIKTASGKVYKHGTTQSNDYTTGQSL